MSRKDEWVKQTEIRYTSLAEKFNKLVKEHNELVDKHVSLLNRHAYMTEDLNYLTRYMVDLTKGLKTYIFGVLMVDDNKRLEKIKAPDDTVLDEGRYFAIEYHNEIVEFIGELQRGVRPTEAYKHWIEKCQAVAVGEVSNQNNLII